MLLKKILHKLSKPLTEARGHEHKKRCKLYQYLSTKY